MKTIKLHIIFLSLFFLISCVENEEEEESLEEKISTYIHKGDFSVPTFWEILYLVKQNSRSLNINSPKKVVEIDFKQALNFGIYNLDLYFLNLNKQNKIASEYFVVTQILADKLKISNFFDAENLKNLAKSNYHSDSLQKLSNQSFKKIMTRLQYQKRENLSTLIYAGICLEALYLGTLSYEKKANIKLKNKICEQKELIEQILLVLETYKKQNNFEELIADFKTLKTVFVPVKIKREEGKGRMIEKNGVLEFEQNTITIIKISKKDFAQIRNVIKLIRNKIVK